MKKKKYIALWLIICMLSYISLAFFSTGCDSANDEDNSCGGCSGCSACNRPEDKKSTPNENASVAPPVTPTPNHACVGKTEETHAKFKVTATKEDNFTYVYDYELEIFACAGNTNYFLKLEDNEPNKDTLESGYISGNDTTSGSGSKTLAYRYTEACLEAIPHNYRRCETFTIKNLVPEIREASYNNTPSNQSLEDTYNSTIIDTNSTNNTSHYG
jgi:hypothetical protein